MQEKYLSYPKRTRQDLIRLVIPEDISIGSLFEVCIKIDSTDIELRDFASYINLIDNIYGRLSRKGLASYSRNVSEHLKISEVRQGSLEIILSEAVENLTSLEKLVVIGLILQLYAKSFKLSASAYRDIEDGRLKRERRKQIRYQLEKDEIACNLDKKARVDFVKLIDIIFSHEWRLLNKAFRFSFKHVLKIEFRIRRKD